MNPHTDPARIAEYERVIRHMEGREFTGLCLLREARDLLWHSPAHRDRCPGCDLERRIDDHLRPTRFDGGESGA